MVFFEYDLLLFSLIFKEGFPVKDKKKKLHSKGDAVFRKILFGVTLFVMVVLGGIFLTLIISSGSAVKRYGARFLVSKAWDQRMTVLDHVDLVQATSNAKRMIRLRFNQAVDVNSINPRNLILLRNSSSRVPLTWMLETNGLSNTLLISPEVDFISMQNYAMIIKDQIKDESGFSLAYSYRVKLDFSASGGIPSIQIDNNKTGKPIPKLDAEDLRWFGAVPFVVGTLLTSILALLISFPFSIAIAIFLGEYFTKGPLASIMQTTSELLAGIPSIIYGFWAFFFVVPMMSKWFPQAAYGGANILTASLILAVMIIPYSSSLAREVISLVPTEIKEAGLGMGATRFEVIRQVILPYASSGIFAGILLAFGRALGETMAVTMVIGNKNHIPGGLIDAGQTIASLIANEFSEAGDLKLSALSELGLILFILTLIFGIIGRYIVKKMSLRGQS